MSEENLQVAREAIEAWNTGDMARLRELYDPDAVMRYPSDWVEPGPFVGRDAIMRQFELTRDIFQGSSLETVEMRDAGDRVVVQVDSQGNTRGLQLTTDMAWVYTIRRGLIAGLEFFHSQREAREAAGLSE